MLRQEPGPLGLGGDPAAQVQNLQAQGDVGDQGENPDPLETLDKPGQVHQFFHGLFVDEPDDVVDGLTAPGGKIRILGIEQMERGDAGQNAPQQPEFRGVLKGHGLDQLILEQFFHPAGVDGPLLGVHGDLHAGR